MCPELPKRKVISKFLMVVCFPDAEQKQKEVDEDELNKLAAWAK